MKIEKISNSQIRCILTGEDLASRHLRLSELAYGSEKARALFRDMMEQAAVQCGFDAENYPLMIEAIPLGSDSIVLIVTKVDNPDELDTRFSNFAPSVQKDAAPAQEPPSPLSQLISSLRENSVQPGPAGSKAPGAGSPEELMKERREALLTSRVYSSSKCGESRKSAQCRAPWRRSPNTDISKRQPRPDSSIWSHTARRSVQRTPSRRSAVCNTYRFHIRRRKGQAPRHLSFF